MASASNDPPFKVGSALQLQRSSCVYRAAGAMELRGLPPRLLAVLHEHNLPWVLRAAVQQCPITLQGCAHAMPQDTFPAVQQADAARHQHRAVAARSGPATQPSTTLTRCWNCRSGEPVRLAALRAALRLLHRRQARSRGRIPSACSHVAHAVPASPSTDQTLQATCCYSRSHLHPVCALSRRRRLRTL